MIRSTSLPLSRPSASLVIQHNLHRNDHHRRNGPGGQCPDQQLRVDLHHRRASAPTAGRPWNGITVRRLWRGSRHNQPGNLHGVNGDIGTTGASTLITGFHDNGPGCIYTETPLNIGMVNGTIDTAPPPPTISCPNEGTAATSDIAANAAADALAAYGALVALPGGLDVSTCLGCGGGSAGELGGRTLAAGSISPRRVRTA